MHRGRSWIPQGTQETQSEERVRYDLASLTSLLSHSSVKNVDLGAYWVLIRSLILHLSRSFLGAQLRFVKMLAEVAHELDKHAP